MALGASKPGSRSGVRFVVATAACASVLAAMGQMTSAQAQHQGERKAVAPALVSGPEGRPIPAPLPPGMASSLEPSTPPPLVQLEDGRLIPAPMAIPGGEARTPPPLVPGPEGRLIPGSVSYEKVQYPPPLLMPGPEGGMIPMPVAPPGGLPSVPPPFVPAGISGTSR